MRHHKPHSGKRLMRKRRRKSRELQAKQYREMRERDARVTAEYGDKAHVMCGRKLRYQSRGDAFDRASRSVMHGSAPLRAYRCPYCGGWHLTSK